FNMPTIALYQIENAALAVMAVEHLADREYISKGQLTEGVRKARWEGRMEEISSSVYLDGAHNTDGIQAFLQSVKQDGCIGKRKLIFSMVKDKQYQAVIDMIASSGLFDVVGVVELQDARALPLQIIVDNFRQYTELQTLEYDKLEHAIQDMTMSCGDTDRMYIVGSLYLVGEVKALIRRSSRD
ncbi:MAG: hypothetical protein K2H31_09010, partial [Lachnospiraceae bacterium]|nr:hypothetical protein [Lachnospiraceae bacterium]